MLSDSFLGSPDKELFSRCRLWYVLAVALTVFSMIAQQPLALLMALFAALIGLLPEIWYRRKLRFLQVRQQYVTPHRLLEDPLRSVGVRDYQIGDDPRQ